MRISLRRCLAAFVAAIIFTFTFCSTPVLGQDERGTDAPEKVLPLAPNYVPMTTEDRWKDYVRQNFTQPGAFFQTFFTALGDQTGNVPSQLGKGLGAFPGRLGSEFARFTIGGTIKAAMAAGLHEDTRFYPCNCRNLLDSRVQSRAKSVVSA